MPLRTPAVAVAFCLVTTATYAQSILDRTVGPNGSGAPVMFRAFTLHQLGELAQAAGVPIGFEGVPASPGSGSRNPIVLTGRTLRDAIELMTQRDPRYAGVEEDGVLLLRSTDADTATATGAHPLDAPVAAVRLGDTTAREAFALVAALLGAPRSTAIQFSDTKSFMLDVPEGTVRSLLNSVARSHGQLVWIFERSRGRQSMFPYSLHFMSGLHGWGLGLSGERPAEPLDLSRFARQAGPAGNVADVIVGTRSDGYPLVLTSLGGWAARDLAAATGIPFGMQVAESPRRGGPAPEFTATGRTLREVLEVLGASDRRYTWRVADGMVVIRPASAWSDPADPLFALVPEVHLEDVPMTEAVGKVLTALGAADHAVSSFPDTKTVSLSVGRGTALDLLTALVKAHGSLTWTLEDGDPDQIRATGLRHRLTLGVPGGVGLGVPVR